MIQLRHGSRDQVAFPSEACGQPIVAADPDSPQSETITEIARQIAARIAVRNRQVLRVI